MSISDSIGRFLDELEKIDSVLIISHRNADADAIVSANLIKKAIVRKKPSIRVEILFPNGISTKSKRIYEHLSMKFSKELKEEYFQYDMLIFIDIGSEEVLESAEKLLEAEKPIKILIDHHIHQVQFLRKFDLTIISDEVSSTCEIAYEIAKMVNLTIDKRTAITMMAAIIIESRFLHKAKCRTFEILREVCKGDIEISEAFGLISRDKDFSEKVAILKGLKRMRIYRVDDWLFVFSNLSAYRSETASQIANIGVDFVAIGTEEDNSCKVHIRISDRFLREIQVDATRDLVQMLISKFGGQGGGHAQVANVTLNTKLEEAFNTLLETLSSITEKKFGKKLTKLE
mgnify:CR=1 FL=1